MSAAAWVLAALVAVVGGAVGGALVYRWLRPKSNDTPWVRRPWDDGGAA